MKQTGTQTDHPGLEGLDPAGTGRGFWNLGTSALCERAVARGEVRLSDAGALVVTTGPAGQPLAIANVNDAAEGGEDSGATDASTLTRAQFEALKADLLAYVGRRTLFGQDVSVDAGPAGDMAVRLLSDQAWHALLIRHLMRPRAAGGAVAPRFTVLCAPGFRPPPETHGAAAEGGVVALDLANGLALVAGTARSEAIRAALAHLLADPLLESGVLPLNGTVTTGPDGEVSLLLGAPGAGKSALAHAPAGDGVARPLVDGALGWGADGLVVLETGAYARPADLAHAPESGGMAPSFGAVLENIALDPVTRTPDLGAATSAAAARAVFATNGGAEPVLAPPTHLFVLIHDDTGVLPALARLSPAQALGHLPAELPAPHIARLRALFDRHAPACWLVNTGWIGGEAGIGRRVPLEMSRRLVEAAQAGELAAGAWRTDAQMDIEVPVALEGVAPALLDPAEAWANRSAYAAAARRLADRFAARRAHIDAASGDTASVVPGLAVAAE